MRAALWIDCDVAILRSPFGGWLGAVASTVDLAHQRNSIAGDINTGVMLVRSEPLARRIASSKWRPTSLGGRQHTFTSVCSSTNISSIRCVTPDAIRCGTSLRGWG